MAAVIGDDIVFVIRGRQEPNAPAYASGALKASVRVSAQRASADAVRVAATPGRDIVVLQIANGPTLILHPESARDLMLAQDAATSVARSAGAPPPAVDAVEVNARLGWPGLESIPTRGATRGRLGETLLQSFQVITGLFQDSAAMFVASEVVRKLDSQVDAGVYKLTADSLKVPLKGSAQPLQSIDDPVDTPLLVLLHGTFVESSSTFGKLWLEHPELVGRLFSSYAGKVYALDHPTVGVSPIANALTLAATLPAGARLHLITHSRGGLVAEVLARACGGVTNADLAVFTSANADGRDYSAYAADLKKLGDMLKSKRIRVDRVVRVACPARGTLLASNRLDAYLSVLKWGLELGQVPVAPELVDFLNAVAQRRTQPTELPGIESMTPQSPLVTWLNTAGDPLPGQLRVVAGDLDGDSLKSWIKTLLADAFFWTDNDLVVQTRSMYGGAPRAQGGATFLRDQGGSVTHFNYFRNPRTAGAVVDAVLNEAPVDFAPIGPLSWGGTDSSGTRGALAARRSSQPRDGVAATERPAVIVLPGILGSNLKRGDKRVWLGLRFINGLKDLAWVDGQSDIADDGPIERVYDNLIEYLADTHEVIRFGYDWRRPMEDEARRLADRVQAALDARRQNSQPVRLLAHSMGGLLARTMQLERPDVWQRMLAREGARVLMLGTPNGGSWSPMQTLSGDDTFGNTLVAFGSLFDNKGARSSMAGMPGFLQLQAGLLDLDLKNDLGEPIDLSRAEDWNKLAQRDMDLLRRYNAWHNLGPQMTVYEWGAPPQPVLDAAVRLRRRLDGQIGKLDADAKKILLVVGHSKFTPAGMAMDSQGLVYLDAQDGGDGRVTLASATQLGVKTWKAEAEHGGLPSLRSAFEAYLDLLQTGETGRLSPLDTAAAAAANTGATRGGTGRVDVSGPLLVKNRPSRGRQSSVPPSSEFDMFGTADGVARSATGPQSGGSFDAADSGAPVQALAVDVVNGNLKFCSTPLMLGHYESARLSGAEFTVDRLIGGAMNESIRAGLYPDSIATQQLFENAGARPPRSLTMPRPPSVVVVGLGEEGGLRLGDLARSVRQGVIACAQRQRDQDGAAGFELTSTLIGSGGTGMSPGVAAHAVVLGVRDANQQLRPIGWPLVTGLHIVELYLDRATEAHRAISVLSEANPGEYVLRPTIATGTGPLRRPPDANYRGAQYDFISVLSREPDDPKSIIEFTLDTQRARSEVRGQLIQSDLVKELVRASANADSTDADIRRALFQLLVPLEIEPFLTGSAAIQLQLDKHTASYPWELLDDGKRSGPDARPWAVRTMLLRKLRTETFRERPHDAGHDGGVLVIGEPKSDPRYGPLDAARAEAESVARSLGATPLLQPDAMACVTALLKEPLRIVHIAGHGNLNRDGTGGVVLTNNMTLGPTEIEAMRTVPQLVFINCCYIGGIGPGAVRRPPWSESRAKFAASVAEQLIRIGVRCVVAAGWAVEDKPAMVFAETFYAQLLAGRRFIDAVHAARGATYKCNPDGNTWAAYQCYGDADWYYKKSLDGESTTESDSSVVSPAALTLTLETMALEEKYGDKSESKQRESHTRRRVARLQQLERVHAPAWGGIGAVAESFGLAYAEHDLMEDAIRWYRLAVAADDSSASFKSAEQLANLVARHVETVMSTEDALAAIETAVAQLGHLVGLGASVERESLLGSACKLRAIIESKRAGAIASASESASASAPVAPRRGRRASTPRGRPSVDSAAERAALTDAARHYGEAERIARATGAGNVYYPAMNALACEMRLAALEGRLPLQTAKALAELQPIMHAAASANPDPWSVAGVAELAMMQALVAGRLAEAVPGIVTELRDLQTRVSSTLMWDSIRKQAHFIFDLYAAPVLSRADAEAARAYLAEVDRLAKGY